MDAFDVQLARKLLAERGNAISDEEIADIEEKRMEELKEPESSQTFGSFGLYTCFFRRVLGIFIGWHLKSHKKTCQTASGCTDIQDATVAWNYYILSGSYWNDTECGIQYNA